MGPIRLDPPLWVLLAAKPNQFPSDELFFVSVCMNWLKIIFFSLPTTGHRNLSISLQQPSAFIKKWALSLLWSLKLTCAVFFLIDYKEKTFEISVFLQEKDLLK